MNQEENSTQGFKGEYTDTITYADGRVEVLEDHNMIVSDINKLIASLLKRHPGHTGLTYWAIGSGQDSWDTNPQSATAEDKRLTTEYFRKAIQLSDIKFINDEGNPVTEVTNRIAITLTFATSEANGKWREFSIFGGDATASINTGLMINHKVHKILTKDDTMTIERQIRFTFN